MAHLPPPSYAISFCSDLTLFKSNSNTLGSFSSTESSSIITSGVPGSEVELWRERLDLGRGLGLRGEPRGDRPVAPWMSWSCFCGLGSLLRLGERRSEFLFLPSAHCQGDFLLKLPNW